MNRIDKIIDEGLCRAYWQCGTILNSCMHIIKRGQETPLIEDEEYDYIEDIRFQCQINGLQDVTVSKNFTTIRGHITVNDKHYKVKMVFVSTKDITIKIWAI